jgi:hypothetical protein
MIGSLEKNYCAIDHHSGKTINIRVQVMQIIMDIVGIFLMKDIKILKPTLRIRVLRT